MKISSNRGEYSLTFCDNALDKVRDTAENSPCHFFVDDRLYLFYSESLEKLESLGTVYRVEAREETKEFTALSKWIDLLIKGGFRRNHTIVTIGGGVLQDMCGFIAATIFRGANWVFVPTTLLAQADSCIGSKVSINFKDLKNMVGLYYPPHEIYVDVSITSSLPFEEFCSGAGEIIKFSLMSKESRTDSVSKDLSNVPLSYEYLESLVRESLSIKKSYFEDDEFDRGRRNMCNYGHCFGHALESQTGFDIPHGQAVLVGILVADNISYSRGLIEVGDRDYHRAVISPFLPKRRFYVDQVKDIVRFMFSDKKRTTDDLTMILCTGDGELEMFHDLREEEIECAWKFLIDAEVI